MIHIEEATKTLKLIVQDAWRDSHNHTTVNEMMGFVIKRALEEIFIPEFELINLRLDQLDPIKEEAPSELDQLKEQLQFLQELLEEKDKLLTQLNAKVDTSKPTLDAITTKALKDPIINPEEPKKPIPFNQRRTANAS